MPFGIQAKILRLLQERSIERLGGRETIPVDVRIIAATNRDLETAPAEGRFREDLYYRLKVVTIWLPPLRERPGDISLLTDYFLSRFSSDTSVDNPGITDEAKAVLNTYPWPGNVRELGNTIQKALIFNRGAPISQRDVSQAISGKMGPNGASTEENAQAVREWVRELLVSGVEKDLFDWCMDRFASIVIGETLNLTSGNRTKAAELLGLSRPTLHSKIEKYKLRLETSVKKE
jgi:DNA-binding NtrC family response regulator